MTYHPKRLFIESADGDEQALTCGHTGKPLRPISFLCLCCSFILLLAPQVHANESLCFGSVGHGRLENGVRLPTEGNNFSSYSTLAVQLGRTYVHTKVARIIVAAYTAMESATPGKVFVYGETGFARGGKIRPHRTHQNGLSVDFFVPVLDDHKKPVTLPASLSNRFGYDIEFDKTGRYQSYHIDFETLAEHLYQLDLAAKANGAGISQVIFDPPYLPILFKTQRGKYLQDHLHFMRSKAWVRHDEHYHVDFNIPCQSFATTRRSK